MDAAVLELRRLAYQYREIANEPRYIDNVKLHRAVNDLAMIRPVVLIDELPWHEMDFDGSLTPVCRDPVLREAEVMLRRTLYRHKYFPADMIVTPYLPLRRVIRDSGIGLTVEERTLAADAANHIISHEYHDQMEDEEVLERLHPPVITYDGDETVRRLQILGDALGDILPIRLVGMEYFTSTTWDNISRYRGVTPLLIDLIERPEYTHRMVRLLTDFELARLRQYEELGLLDPDAQTLHCTCAKVSALPGSAYDGAAATRKDVWGRGAAQIFATVSKAMHEEFDIQYMKETVGSCGLCYYGCCEPLDKKIDIAEKLPNLRKVGVTPWADARAAAEAIAGRFVVAAKPNPAAVAVPSVDEEHLRAELSAIISACRDNNCSCDIVLKDISTCLRRPENIFTWERVAMEIVTNA